MCITSLDKWATVKAWTMMLLWCFISVFTHKLFLTNTELHKYTNTKIIFLATHLKFANESRVTQIFLR